MKDKRTLWKCTECQFPRRVVGKPITKCVKCGNKMFCRNDDLELYVVGEPVKKEVPKDAPGILSPRLDSAFDSAKDDMVKMRNSIDNLILSLRNEEGLTQGVKMVSKERIESLLIDLQQIINTIHEHDRLVEEIGRNLKQEVILRNKIYSLLDIFKKREI